MTLKSSIKYFRFLPLSSFFLPNPIIAFPVVPAEQLVCAPELDPELACQHHRAMLGEMFGIKSDSTKGVKLQLSQAVGVWQVSRKRVSERDTASAVAKAHGESREMARSCYLYLLQAFRKEQGKDEELPSRGIVEGILEQLEEGELHTVQLPEVVSREQEDRSVRKSSTESELTLRVDGSWTRKPRRIYVQTPKSETELRLRYAIHANAWEFVRLKNPSRRVLRDLKPATWEKRLKWFLSEKVARRSVTMGQQSTGTPPWEFLIQYEWQVRRRAVKAINEKRATWVEALWIARQDQHRNTHFIAPSSIGAKWATVSSTSSSSQTAASAAAAASDPTPNGDITAINKRSDKLQSLISNLAKGKGKGDTSRTVDRADRRGDGGAVRKDIKKDGKCDHPKDTDLKQDFNVWMRKPSLWKRLLLSVGDRQACFGFEKGDCKQGPPCQYSHMCAVCGIGKPFSECDCVKGNRIR